MTEDIHTPSAVYALAASPNYAEDGICFAACRSGLFRSEDRGESWQYAYGSLNLEAPLATLAVAVSPDFVSDQSVFAGAPGGILRSVNGGADWNVAMLPSPPPLVSTLVISPNFARDGVLLAGSMEDGVFRSAYRGVHWSRWNFGLLDLHILAMAISPAYAADETLFVGSETGVFRSSNGGRAWREVEFPIEYAPVLSLALSPDFENDRTLFAGTEAHGLFRSEDAGKTWKRISVDGVDEAVNGVLLSPDFPAKPHILMMLSTAFMISRDGGKTWNEWHVQTEAEGFSCVLAPQGLDEGAPLLVGLVEGGILRV
ncbi:MAG: hypothetical protein GX620_05180 [Chloroflexi bacterium]|nr:hypothetical protein [Chloroflexota bacterium]